MTTKNKYVHTAKMHNMIAPRIIVKNILKYYKPKSVVDFGCGLGTFLKAFKEEGINEVLGLDASWVNKKLLSEFLNAEEFNEVDLEQTISLNKKFDLAISLEVAEHLNEKKASVFVENLVNASKVILFSAAIPYQGGQNHINEQWVEYWQEKFKDHNYSCYDVMRENIWLEENVKWWYKQNMFLAVKDDFVKNLRLDPEKKKIFNFIHPEHYELKSKEHLDFRLGKSKPKIYFKLFLKSMLYKLNLIKD
jgi:SAM-dependent methyltransferase